MSRIFFHHLIDSSILMIIISYSLWFELKPTETQIKLQSNSIISTDTAITIDDYPITEKMLEKKKYINGNVISEEYVWFTNDTLKQSLLFELYTDYHRLSITHFLNDQIPSALYKKLLPASQIDCDKDNKNCIGFKLRSADRISKKYFTSNKGVQLNKTKQEVINIYGPADTVLKFKDCEMYFWDFVGDLFIPDSNSKKKKAYAKDSFGYQVMMFFKNDVLIAMTLYNDIP